MRKRIICLSLSFAIIVLGCLSMFSCTNNINIIEPITDTGTSEIETRKNEYEIYTYKGGEGGPMVTPDYSGKELFVSNMIEKEGVEKKSIVIFDDECAFSYAGTIDFGVYDERYDDYISDKCIIQVGENTGRIGSFSHGNPNSVRFSIVPPVNAHSTCQEFIDYASDVLLKYSGVSTSDCEVEIKTSNIHTTYKYTKEEINQDFVNFIDYDPSFTAEYKIVFHKKLGGINRIDDISVTIKNDGTVKRFRARVCDEKFKKFSGVFIDKELVMKMVADKFKHTVSGSDLMITDKQLYAVPDGDNLWVLAKVYYKWASNGVLLSSVIQFLVKVV